MSETHFFESHGLFGEDLSSITERTEPDTNIFSTTLHIEAAETREGSVLSNQEACNPLASNNSTLLSEDADGISSDGSVPGKDTSVNYDADMSMGGQDIDSNDHSQFEVYHTPGENTLLATEMRTEGYDCDSTTMQTPEMSDLVDHTPSAPHDENLVDWYHSGGFNSYIIDFSQEESTFESTTAPIGDPEHLEHDEEVISEVQSSGRISHRTIDSWGSLDPGCVPTDTGVNADLRRSLVLLDGSPWSSTTQSPSQSVVHPGTHEAESQRRTSDELWEIIPAGVEMPLDRCSQGSRSRLLVQAAAQRLRSRSQAFLKIRSSRKTTTASSSISPRGSPGLRSTFHEPSPISAPHLALPSLSEPALPTALISHLVPPATSELLTDRTIYPIDCTRRYLVTTKLVRTAVVQSRVGDHWYDTEQIV